MKDSQKNYHDFFIIFFIINIIIIIYFATGDSDAYAIVCLNDLAGRPNKIEVFRTVEKKKTLTPEWNQTFEFGEWVVMEMSMMMMMMMIWIGIGIGMMLCYDVRVMLKIVVMMIMTTTAMIS